MKINFNVKTTVKAISKVSEQFSDLCYHHKQWGGCSCDCPFYERRELCSFLYDIKNQIDEEDE